VSAPLVVNTTDGTCWTRRAVTRDGLALYAPEGVCRCPEFVMATLAELAEHGIAGSADALPMPVGVDKAEESADKLTRLLAPTQVLLSEATAHCERCGKAVAQGARWCSTWCHTGIPAGAQTEPSGVIPKAAPCSACQPDCAVCEGDCFEFGCKACHEKDAPELTVYRASHDSIVFGHYTTAAAAREHCETVVRREHSDSSVVRLWWREDEDTVDQPEDGEQELIEHVKSSAVPGPGYTRPTGYVVTPLTVASAYDEEADE
jgi:hypothetical protein